MRLLQLSFLAAGCLVLCLCNKWGIRLPKDLNAWKGTCVQIPCKIDNNIGRLHHFVLYHNPQYINNRFQGTVLFDINNSSKTERTKLLDSRREKNCSMLIREVQVSDDGVLGLRIVDETDDKWMEEMKLRVNGSAPSPQIQLPQPLKESQEVTVTCSLKYYCSEYPVSLLWSLEGQRPLPDQVQDSFSLEVQKISTESKLTLSLNWTHHGKKLACQLWHFPEGRLSEEIVQLDVKHAPKVTLVATSSLEVKEGDSVTLRCLLQSSNPEIQDNFFWFRNKEIELKMGEILNLSRVTWQQAGSYHCGADNEIGRGTSEPVTLQVLYAPKDSKVDPAQVVKSENETVEMTCQSSANPLPTNYSWFKDGKLMPGETKQQLRFQEVKRQQSGQYACLAENSEGQGEVSKAATLDVQYPPTGVTVTIKNLTPIREGDTVNLTCSYNQSNPSVSKYLWRTQFSQYNRIRSKFLTINSIPWNAKSVICTACHVQCSSSPPVHLDIQYAPKDVKIILITPQSDIQSGDQVHLQCDFSSSQPRNVGYSWTRNGKHFYEGKSLNWSSISPEDSGLYRCFIYNSVGKTQSQEWDLKIQYAPRHLQVSITPSDMVMEKTSVVLTCEADANPAIELYTWFDWKGQKMDNFGPKLTLWPVMTHQSGAYWCRGTNKLGTGESHPTILTVYYSPETIGRRTALGFGVCLALLVLAFTGFQFVRCWKKIRGQQDLQAQPSRQGSFFIRNKKIRRPYSTTAPQSLGYYNPAVEERIEYSTLQFPPQAQYMETSRINLQTEDESVTYSVVQKSHRSDYENVAPVEVSPPEEEGLHYSELIHFGERERPPAQEGVEYVTLKH
ncbi:B-cell receptor CD22 [Gracilinanus agilis]|uniref:B-cell receptor CD22 n=1 Tax=Gracilinanus agilis TaxID=191870 RepID=UPI001CFD00D6|nr:B-cell receptor CD22 [Gracilinanus agilis]